MLDSNAATLDLWARAADDTDARNALIEENLSLVHHVAQQLSRSLAATVDFDELVSAGSFGLMSAIDKFDAARGLAFSTFAVPRIRGAILDELRRQDHVPRSVRRKARDVGAAREEMMRTLGRVPDQVELAEHMGIDLATLWKWEADVQAAVQVPVDRSSPAADGDTAPSPWEMLHDEDEDAIDDVLSREQEVAILREAIMSLKEQERTVLALYYFEELKLHEIADILGLTESRVSQIRSKALLRLRDVMKPRI